MLIPSPARLLPLKIGITWPPRHRQTPLPQCSPSRSPRPRSVVPQKPRLSRTANPQHRKSLGVNDQRFPFSWFTKRFLHFRHFPSCFSRGESHAPLFLIGLSPLHFPTGRLSPRTSFFSLYHGWFYFFEASFEKKTRFIVYNFDIFFNYYSCFFFSSFLFIELRDGCRAVFDSRTLLPRLQLGLLNHFYFIFLSFIFPSADLVGGYCGWKWKLVWRD